ncbi:MBL fold metallo-hydrolase [Tenacibaculum finnmarkense genomovar finnmarkense]|uniref:MBL fold metallo-hydrolase n=1 Tax=Tenacibaculum finnmarkense TaxID=2781243 RepID=UPI001E378DCC|nr:MBL fold metallo-hydrolase [Tenacibaculum finnmarkense]MCD8417053.1 MBL fold metallo-hydrolase [Tenacibaculum finnmarkense genomovar finnmarkense]MCG8184554.1 MBL fold metallo-hydrolase [Tenacibaculum finnmarkense genomovar finnmarkense]MCG8201985.1 MBL fold metallo-hydrolase [Tenacibaculum finnmarkense genomovar finnmarkense]MCG8208740.1 MBL fold metallo-hydrolase [Tenacibaculum finnmarkense genomovar finnmarkense]MCG8211471.1 MBL fold metallo-hydrolase [Tenacibaculum finnmarkense genomova
MQIFSIETGNFKLDGGAMFGVVPKTIWQKTNPADANNLISLSMRCMLIKNGDRLTLIDTGVGNKQSDKFFGYYYLFGDFSLDTSLAKHGFHRDDITDVFLTHLHFDHCGGVIQWNNDKTGYMPAFKNAKVWSNQEHWQWATVPNAREKASFLKENIQPIQQNGQLNFIDKQPENFQSQLGFDVLFMDGHTEKQMLPKIQYQGKTVVFMADLLPTAGHIPLPYVMGYDTRPLLSIAEKRIFLNEAADKNFYLFLEHDAHNELITVKHTEKGVRLNESYKFTDIFN